MFIGIYSDTMCLGVGVVSYKIPMTVVNDTISIEYAVQVSDNWNSQTIHDDLGLYEYITKNNLDWEIVRYYSRLMTGSIIDDIAYKKDVDIELAKSLFLQLYTRDVCDKIVMVYNWFIALEAKVNEYLAS